MPIIKWECGAPFRCVGCDVFMREVVFGDFRFPARERSRAARRAANEARGCKPPRPHDPRRGNADADNVAPKPEQRGR